MAIVSNGFIDLRNGMNAGRNPVLLPDTQCARAINVTFRGGLVATRPAFSEVAAPTDTGAFRGAGRWSLEGSERLVFVLGNSVYALDIASPVPEVVATRPGPFTQCYFLQADRYLVIQDAVGDPLVLQDTDGVISVVQSGVSLPPGYFGIYAHGRIHYVPTRVPGTGVSGKPYLISGDILDPSNPEYVLKYTEGEYLAEGGAHALPAELGFIGGLGVLRNAQTGTGLGAIIALARNGLCAFDFSISRSLWKEQAISNVLFTGAGCRSPRAVAGLNDDLVYRAVDGIRSLRYSASQIASGSGSLSNTPMSQEVATFLDADYPFLSYVALAAADSRLFCTASAYAAGSFKGLVVWDVGASFYSGVTGAGAYDGLWTGALFLQALSALSGSGDQLFVFAGINKLYTLDYEAVLDPGNTPIEARIETKSYNFGDMVTLKKLQYVELWLGDIATNTTVKVWYRPHGYPLWKLLGTRTIVVPEGSLPQARGGFRFSLDYSDENCDPVTKQPLYVATAFQFAIQWTGRATIECFQANAEPSMKAPPDVCSEVEGAMLTSSAMAGEMFDDFSYTFRGSD